MNEDLHGRLAGLIDAEARASERSRPPEDLARYRSEIRARRTARAGGAVAVVAAVGLGVAATLAWGGAGIDQEPATTLERAISFAPDVEGYAFEADGALRPARDAYRQLAPAGEPPGCAVLDEYAELARPADVWTDASDLAIRTGTLTGASGSLAATVSVRWFADGGGQSFAEDFAALALACGAGFTAAGEFLGDSAVAADAVETGTVAVAGSGEPAVTATVELTGGAGDAVLAVLAVEDAAVGVIVAPDAVGDADAVVADVLEDFVRHLGSPEGR